MAPKDKALEKWLEHQPAGMATLGGVTLGEQIGTQYIKDTARAAWHAAVKHTLAFVVNELHRGPWHEGKIKFETIEAISKMEP